MSRHKQDLVTARGISPVTRHPDIACRGADAELFFPSGNVPPVEALAICGRCPHTDECLQWALDTGQRHGVWGGTTGPERDRISAEQGRR